MKKIALVTCYFHLNYGSMLQAYATQKYFDDRSIPCENIRIDGLKKSIESSKKRFYLKQIMNPQVLTGTILRIGRKKIVKKLHKQTLGNDLKIRENKFNDFVNQNFRLSKEYQSISELSGACSDYSTVLVGSDQLWLPSNIDADYYTLNWVPEDINKVSYATSFGTSYLPDNLKSKTKSFLTRIQHISVREETGVKIIRECAGIEAELVCDPTLLFNAEQWMCIQKKEPIIDGDYILCYFLGNNKKDREFAKRLRERTGYKIVALLHLDEYIKSDIGYADETPFDIGPGELINLIRNAEYIVTDSFHGSVFSILNKKIFFTSRRIKKKGLLDTNNRLDSLFDTLGITGRLITGDEDIDECLSRKLHYDDIHKNLEALRESSVAFLDNAIKGGI